MDSVYASLFQTVCAFFLTEARRIAGQSLRQLFFRNNCVDKFTDHGMFGSTDQVKIFAFDLVHHSIHFRKAHNACYNIASDHERRYTVGKASVNHEISCICDNCGMQSCNIAHQIVETVSCNLSCAV